VAAAEETEAAPPVLQPQRANLTRRYLRVNEVAELFGMHRATVYRAVADGRLPAPRRLPSGRLGWPAEEIDELCANLPRVQHPSGEVNQDD